MNVMYSKIMNGFKSRQIWTTINEVGLKGKKPRIYSHFFFLFVRHVCSYVKYIRVGTCYCRKQAHCQVFQLYKTMSVREKYTDCSSGVSDSQHSQQTFLKLLNDD